MHIFLRHCANVSQASVGKQRPIDFNREELLNHFASTLRKDANEVVVVVIDGKKKDHFAAKKAQEFGWQIRFIEGGCEANAFLQLLLCIEEFKLQDEEEVVILEDDYLVKAGWQVAVEEGLKVADYVTCYDHPDKYTAMYSHLVSKVYKTATCHWRTTPSTTNSFASTAKMLRFDKEIHQEYSAGRAITADHFKFLALWKQSRVLETLVSSIPAFWSHEEMGMQCQFKT